jgi:hypothetical protein
VLILGPQRNRGSLRWVMLCLAILLVGFIWVWRTIPPGEAWVTGGSNAGFTMGVIAGGIIVFEMLLIPRKRWRWFSLFSTPAGTRVSFLGRCLLPARTMLLGKTKIWMELHIWLGLLSLPLAMLHSGISFWTEAIFSLPWILECLLVIVWISGLYGLWRQHVLPRQLLPPVTMEVPVVQIEPIMQHHRREFEDRAILDWETWQDHPQMSSVGTRLKLLYFGPTADVITPERLHHLRKLSYERQTRLAKKSTEESDKLPTDQDLCRQGRPGSIQRYLMDGRSRGPFAGEGSALHEFEQLRNEIVEAMAKDTRDATAEQIQDAARKAAIQPLQMLADLEELCRMRRQFSIQKILHQRLHRWLYLVHLPVSVVMFFYLIVHVFTAMKFL